MTIAAGGFDVMTSMRDVVAFAETIPHAVVHVAWHAHAPAGVPDRIMDMIHDMFDKVTFEHQTPTSLGIGTSSGDPPQHSAAS